MWLANVCCWKLEAKSLKITVSLVSSSLPTLLEMRGIVFLLELCVSRQCALLEVRKEFIERNCVSCVSFFADSIGTYKGIDRMELIKELVVLMLS